MPTVLREDGFRVFFYTNENNEPRHVHVERAGELAKFWLQDPVKLAENRGLKRADLRRARLLVQKHRADFERKWDEVFSE